MNNNTIHVSIAGGFGNQLFQVSAALKLTNSSVIVHDFQKNARRHETGELEIQRYSLPKRVQFSSNPQISRIGKRFINLLYVSGSKSQSRPQLVLRKIALLIAPFYFSSILRTKVKVIVASDLGDFPYQVPDAETLVIGYFQSWEWSQPLSDWAADLNLSPTFNEKDLPIYRREKDSYVICLHIRRGDYISDNRIGTLSNNYFKRALNNLILTHPEAEVWLFSDDVLAIEEWIHPDYLSQVRVVPKASTDLTFEAMRHANAYILSNSTFSWWAARTSYATETMVVAPLPWFKNLRSPKGIIPNRWDTLEADFS